MNVANLFIADGPIVSTHSDRSDNENFVYTARRSRLMVDAKIPLVVLVDKGSASAAEILAGALKDTGRAMLIGATTYGKGSVQQIRQIGGANFKLTNVALPHALGRGDRQEGHRPDRTVVESTLTPEEEKGLSEVLNSTWLADFAKANPRPTAAQVDGFVAGLRAKGIVLNERYLRRLVRNEIEKTNNAPAVYDLDFDMQLGAAVKALTAGEVAGGGKVGAHARPLGGGIGKEAGGGSRMRQFLLPPGVRRPGSNQARG